MRFVGKITLYVLLIIGAITMLVPLLWMFSTSLQTQASVFTYPPQLIPPHAKWGNYLETWKAVPFGRFYINSIVVAVSITLGQVVTSCLAAYAFARLEFPGRDAIFLGYLATMMIPGVITMIPMFILLRTLGGLSHAQIYINGAYAGNLIGLDSYFALIVPMMFSPFGTFLLRQFFLSTPRELEDAAKIDGCGYVGILRYIILPLSVPALAALFLFVFMGSWRDFMWPLIVTNSIKLSPLPLGLSLFQGLYTTNWPLLMAGSLMVMAPLVIVFLMSQRYFVEGVKLTGVKG